MNRPSVMFVDDEPHILSGLRRALSAQRSTWTMHFAGSAEEALQLMAGCPVDVVVSDMRMPGMNGAQLLSAVREQHPATARIVLSGHAELEAIIAAIGPTQQFLAKPCDAATLVHAVESALATQRMVADESMQRLLGGVASLPKPPAIYQEMVAVVSRPDCSIADVVAVVERDIATGAEVLKLVNSAFFALPVPVDSLARAVSLLGLETIQALALAGAVFQPGDHPLPPGTDADGLRSHGVLSGTLAKRIARHEGWPPESQNHAMLAGLLHEVGLLVLAGHRPQALAELPGADAVDIDARQAAERAAFGCTVAEASAYLLGSWGFPEPIVQAIVTRRPGPQGWHPTALARALDVASCHAAGHPVATTEDPAGYLDEQRLAAWLALCEEPPGRR